MNFYFGTASTMVGDVFRRVRRQCPAEDPVGFVCTHINTAMTHRCAKVFMPVGAMKCMTHFSKEGCPGNTRQYIAIRISEQVTSFTYIEIAISHMLGRVFINDLEIAAWCCR